MIDGEFALTIVLHLSALDQSEKLAEKGPTYPGNTGHLYCFPLGLYRAD